LPKIGNWLYVILVGIAAALLLKKPKKGKKINWETARVIQIKAFGQGNWSIYDRYVWTLNKESMQDFLDGNEIKDRKYEAERHDCDDFAYSLKGAMSAPGWSHYAFSFGISKVHAYNPFIDENEEMQIIEPQQGRIFSVKELNIELKPYRIKGDGEWAKLGQSKLGQIQQWRIALNAVSYACDKTTNKNSLKIYLKYLHAGFCETGFPEATQEIYATVKTEM